MRVQDWLRVAMGMFIIAFGANLFAPMVMTYQVHAGLSRNQTTFLFGIYAAGLIVALFVGGPLSDTYGRRAIIRPALLCSILGSIVLLFGHAGSFTALLIGRLTIGVAVGLVMSSGAAWIKELSQSVSVAATRASVSITLGFATAPALSGIIAQFVPAPTITPYIIHIALVLCIAPITWTAPPGIQAQTDVAKSKRSTKPGAKSERSTKPGANLWPHSLMVREFIPVALKAPWVFGVVTTAFAYLPTLLGEHIRFPMAVVGLLGLLTMGTGALASRVALSWPRETGMLCAALGMAAGLAIAANHANPWSVYLLPVACVLLGISYGANMVTGLASTQSLAHHSEVGSASGVFYALTYLGFFAPFILSLLAPVVGNVTSFSIGIAVALATSGFSAVVARSK